MTRETFRSHARHAGRPEIGIRPFALILKGGAEAKSFVDLLDAYADNHIRSVPSYGGEIPRVALLTGGHDSCAVVWCTDGVLAGLREAFPDKIARVYPVTARMLKVGRLSDPQKAPPAKPTTRTHVLTMRPTAPLFGTRTLPAYVH